MPTPPPPACETLSKDEIAALSLDARIMAFTRPGAMLHSILAAALEQPCLYEATYARKACLTSDGFVMAGFTGVDGAYHSGAFVNSAREIKRNVTGLLDLLTSTGVIDEDERAQAVTRIQGWVSGQETYGHRIA